MRPLLAAILPALAALVLSAPAHADAIFGVADDAGKYAEDGGFGFFGGMRSVGLTGNRITVQYDAARPNADRREALPRPLDADRRRARDPRRLRALPDARRRAHRLADRARPVRRVGQAARAHVPAGEGLRRRQRAEQELLLAPAVRRRRHARRGRHVPARARRLVRRAQGRSTRRSGSPASASPSGGTTTRRRRATSRRRRSASSATSAPPTARAGARRRSWTSSCSTRIRSRRPTTC